MEIPVIRNLLEANERQAETLRDRFARARVLVVNIISSPGSGKTSLLERTLADLRARHRMAVIEGDCMTDNDARRVAATGAAAVQINTEGGCHLSSAQIAAALEHLDLENLDILFIENVGNMVCPVEFDVGEDCKVALLSVTEGDDKPEKYPRLFQEAKVTVLNKVDLLPYVDFDPAKASRQAMALNAGMAILPVSCRTGEGLAAWYAWLENERSIKRGGTA